MSQKKLLLMSKLGTLLVVGLLLLSNSPVTALAADDLSTPENPTPTVENVESVEVVVSDTIPTEDTSVEIVEEVIPIEETQTFINNDIVPETSEVVEPVAAKAVSPLVVSDEFGGDTANQNQDTDEDDGEEQSFTTLPSGGCTSACGGGEEEQSGENNFVTLPGGVEVVSTENNFRTLASGGCTNNCGGDETVVGAELSFRTLADGGCTNNCGNGDEQVSGENSFTTSNGGGGDDDDNDDGGGGGGGGHRKKKPAPTEPLPLPCELYLKKFIRLGYANDPFEVTKLEVFLNSFEGFNLPVNGIYEQHDFEAVKIFQQRYGGAVLTPWGLEANDPTGYVYITTTLTINQIYCHRTVGNELDLRSVFPVYGAGEAGVPAVTGLTVTTTPTTTPSIIDLPELFQAAAVGVLNFLQDWWCLLLLIILILIIAYLLDERARLKDELERQVKAAPIAELEKEWQALPAPDPDIHPDQEELTKL